jgi:hypothetical protein
MNAYMLFTGSVRAEIKAENPDLTMGEIVSNHRTVFVLQIMMPSAYSHLLDLN